MKTSNAKAISAVKRSLKDLMNYQCEIDTRVMELEDRLDSIGTGGVEPLKPQPQVVKRPKCEQEPVATLSIEVAGSMTKIDFEWSDLVHQLPAGNHKLFIQSQPQSEPLTPSEIDQIEARWDARLHGSKIAFAARETERAHGIGSKA